MGGHISIEETFFVDAVRIESECPICFQRSECEIGWVASRCGSCGTVYDHEIGSGMITRKRRENLSISRQDMAKLMGVKRATIAKYEQWFPSRRYWEFVREMAMNTRST